MKEKSFHNQFPDPIELPRSVQDQRISRNKDITRSTLLGVFLRLAIIVMEFTAVYFFGSAALFTDALSTLVDVAFSIGLIVCIKLADRPPDENHPFGHGRLEPIFGMQLGLVLSLLGCAIFFQQSFESIQEGKSEITSWLWIIPLCSILLLEGAYQIIIRVAKRVGAPAMVADAYHYRVDALTSVVATIALFIGQYVPEYSGFIDHLGAVVIACMMICLGFSALRANFNQLVDRKPSPIYFQWVRDAALSVKGVHETEKMRIQVSGPDAHVDIDIEVDPHLTVEKAHKISQEVRAAIQKKWPQVRDATVHIEPYYPNDH